MNISRVFDFAFGLELVHRKNTGEKRQKAAPFQKVREKKKSMHQASERHGAVLCVCASASALTQHTTDIRRTCNLFMCTSSSLLMSGKDGRLAASSCQQRASNPKKGVGTNWIPGRRPAQTAWCRIVSNIRILTDFWFNVVKRFYN